MTNRAERADAVPVPSRRQSLQGIPVLETGVAVDEPQNGNGGMVLISRRPRKEGWLSRFVPPTLERRLELDELGAFVVHQFDGSRDVATIAEAFSEQFSVCLREAQLCTVAFLKQLTQKRFAAIAMR